MIRVIDARHIKDFIVWVHFNDGTKGEIDLSDELYGPIFEPLRDPEYFANFEVHAEAHTLSWPNGADFAPEFLHHKITVAA